MAWGPARRQRSTAAACTGNAELPLSYSIFCDPPCSLRHTQPSTPPQHQHHQQHLRQRVAQGVRRVG